MKRILVVAAVFIIVIGCGFLSACGESVPGFAAAPTIAGGISDGPFGPLTPCTTDCEPDDPDGPTPPPPPPPPPPTTPRITCFEKVLAEGTVGTPHSQTIEAAGGSGDFEYELAGGELPAGLSLSNDGTISGTPTGAAKAASRVRATDSDGKKKTCPLEITIRGDLELEVTPFRNLPGSKTKASGFSIHPKPSAWDNIAVFFANPEPSAWDIVYKVVASSGVDAVAWTWVGDTSNVCMNSTPPNTSTQGFRSSCTAGTKITSGNIAYVWLKADRPGSPTLSLKLTVTSPYVPNPASHTFEFRYTAAPTCGNGVKEDREECDGSDGVSAGFTCNDQCKKEKIPATIKSVKVEIITGKLRESIGTDGDIRVSFGKQDDDQTVNMLMFYCKSYTDSGQNKSTHMGNTYQFVISPPDGCRLSTEDLKYFRVQLISPETDLWMLQEIKVSYQVQAEAESTWHLAYWNPYLLRFLKGGSTGLTFGPKDTAVGVVTQVSATVHEAGTNNWVWLVSDGYNGFDTQNGSMWWCQEFEDAWTMSFCSPSFRKGSKLRMLLDWEPYSDFRGGMETSYGDYVFDRDLYFDGRKKPADVKITKDNSDGLALDDANIYVFHPASSFTMSGNGSIAINPEDPVWHAGLRASVILDNDGQYSPETEQMKFEKIAPDDPSAFNEFSQGGGKL